MACCEKIEKEELFIFAFRKAKISVALLSLLRILCVKNFSVFGPKNDNVAFFILWFASGDQRANICYLNSTVFLFLKYGVVING